MARFYSLLLVFTLSIFSFSPVRASHLTGGEITWKCITSGTNKGKFIFTIKIYCACYTPSASCPTSSANIQNPLYATYGGPSSITCARILNMDVATQCYDPALSIKCGLTIANGGAKAMDENVYESSPIQINGVPDSSGSDFYWTSCCRPGSNLMRNIITGGYYLRATMYPYIEPGNSSPESMGSTTKGPACYDSSPKFAALPNIWICMKDSGTLNNGSIDYDSDENKYLWAEPLLSASNGVTYKTGYGIYNQLPDSNFHPNNTGGILDTTTGIISYGIDSFPVSSSAIYHNICTKIQSYRHGQLISEVYRDMLYTIFDCSPTSLKNSNSPSIEIKEASATVYQQNFSKSYDVGSNIELDIRIQDFDSLNTNPVSKQSVSLEIYGEAMSDDVNNTTSCDITPCAYLDSNNLAWKSDIFIDTSSLEVRFKWTPDCKHVKHKALSKYGGTVSHYKFTIVARDNYCPVPRTSFKSFYITIDDTGGVSMKIDTLIRSSAGTYVGWNTYSQPNFTAYNVFKRSNASSNPWTLITTISNAAQSAYLDPNPSISYHYDYYLVKMSPIGCIYGDVSNSIGLKAKQSGYNAALTWNNAYEASFANPTGTYKLYRQDSSSTVWNLINTQAYNNTGYLDLNPPYNVLLKYKVEASDSYPLYAVSNISEVTIEKNIDTSNSVNAIIPGNLRPLIYPNPFKDNVNIDCPKDLVELKIYNQFGQLVREVALQKGLNTIDLTSYEKGMYIFEILSKEGSLFYERIIKY